MSKFGVSALFPAPRSILAVYPFFQAFLALSPHEQPPEQLHLRMGMFSAALLREQGFRTKNEKRHG